MWDKIRGGRRECNVINIDDKGRRQLSEIPLARQCARDDKWYHNHALNRNKAHLKNNNDKINEDGDVRDVLSAIIEANKGWMQ